jgi:hypothetical protein
MFPGIAELTSGIMVHPCLMARVPTVHPLLHIGPEFLAMSQDEKVEWGGLDLPKAFPVTL